MVVQTIDTRSLYTQTPKQANASATLARYVLFGGAVGGGKSAWLCNEALDLSLDYPGNVGYLCRHELTSFRRTTLRTLQRFLPDGLIALHHKSEQYYDLINGSRIYYGGLGDEHGLERLKSMDLGWAGIDQCEETSEDHFFMLASRLRLVLPDGSKPLYKLLCTANPDPGWPRQRWIEQKLPDHVFIPALPADNPHLPDDYEANLRDLFPPDLAQALLGGDWDVMSAGQYVIPYRYVKEAVDRELPRGDDPSSCFGVDVARGGADKSVLCWRIGPVVIRYFEWQLDDTYELAKEVWALALKNRPDHIIVDTIGLGAGFYDSLWHMRRDAYRKAREDAKRRGEKMGEFKPQLTEFNASEKATDRETYPNRRSEAYFGLSRRARDGDLDLPNHPLVRSGLASIQYRVNDRGQLQVEAKDAIKKRLGRSPDHEDATVYAFAPPRRGGIWL